MLAKPWLGRRPRRSVGGTENPLREAMRSRGGLTIKPTAPTDIEDNEAAPENSTLDWLNLNALGSRAIQGAIDRMRASTLGAGEAEVQTEGLLMSPRRSAPEPRPEGYPSGRKSLGNALRTRGGITRPSRAEAEPSELNEEPMVHADTAPVLDRTITEPLPSVQEEDHMPHSPLMTPKATPKASQAEPNAMEADIEPQKDQDEDVEGTTAPEELDEIRDEGSLEQTDMTDEAMPVAKEESALESQPERRDSRDSPEETRPKAKDPKDPEKSAAPRLPLPTPLMAATASAKRAEPPAVVVKPQKEELPSQPVHQLPAPDAYLKSIPTAKEVGKLKELREFWGNKSSKGFAGPGLAGSRLSKVEAQATLQRLLIAGGDLDEVRRLRKIIAELEAA